MEMRHDEVGVGYMHIQDQGNEKKASQTANGKQADKAESIEHGRRQWNASAMQRHCPVEHFNGRGHRDQVTEKWKHQPRINGLAADKHMVAPN